MKYDDLDLNNYLSMYRIDKNRILLNTDVRKLAYENLKAMCNRYKLSYPNDPDDDSPWISHTNVDLCLAECLSLSFHEDGAVLDSDLTLSWCRCLDIIDYIKFAFDSFIQTAEFYAFLIDKLELYNLATDLEPDYNVRILNIIGACAGSEAVSLYTLLESMGGDIDNQTFWRQFKKLLAQQNTLQVENYELPSIE